MLIFISRVNSDIAMLSIYGRRSREIEHGLLLLIQSGQYAFHRGNLHYESYQHREDNIFTELELLIVE